VIGHCVASSSPGGARRGTNELTPHALTAAQSAAARAETGGEPRELTRPL
jgi:hypothetical protein